MRSRKGTTSLALATGLITIALVTAQPAAQDRWYQSYQAGVDAFNRGDFRTAEQKLQAAVSNRQAPAYRGRSVLYISQQRGEFIPEYYLAVIYAKQEKFRDAIRYADLAEKYLKAGDKDFTKEYAGLRAARTDAERGLTPARVVAGNTTTPPPPVVPPIVQPIPAGRGSDTRRTDFDRLLADATSALTARRFADARQRAASAKDLGVDNPRADDVLRTIDVEDLTAQVNAQVGLRAWSTATPLVDRLVSLDPSNSTARSARQTITRGLAEDEAKRLERAGLGAFYRGSYQDALTTLAKVPQELVSPRVLFYQACSTAALGLLEGAKGQPRLQRARELFRRAQPQQNAFTLDRKYISPRIIQALERGAG